MSMRVMVLSDIWIPTFSEQHVGIPREDMYYVYQNLLQSMIGSGHPPLALEQAFATASCTSLRLSPLIHAMQEVTQRRHGTAIAVCGHSRGRCGPGGAVPLQCSLNSAGRPAFWRAQSLLAFLPPLARGRWGQHGLSRGGTQEGMFQES